ncbi:MAG: hypothetical protein ACK4GT_19665 [Pararhodobacter sp.]
MTNSPNARGNNTTADTRRAKSAGLGLAAVGIILFNVAPFLNWVGAEDSDDIWTGYETDSLVPFMAYLGLGLLIALLYASKRASRGQHRGLSLVSTAVGLAVSIQCVAFALEPMGALERGDNLAADIGPWVGFLAAGLWAIGSGLLSKEIEGDDRVDTHSRGAGAA